jgi:type III restriction enzyme
VVEIKDDGEIAEPSAENVKKHEYATAHFTRLNEWLEKEKRPTRYQFNMLSPVDFGKFFTKMRKRDLVGFRSELDVAMASAKSGR